MSNIEKTLTIEFHSEDELIEFLTDSTGLSEKFLNSLLLDILFNRWERCLSKVLDLGANPNHECISKTKYGTTIYSALGWASVTGNFQLIKKLVENKADPMYTYKKGNTLIHLLLQGHDLGRGDLENKLKIIPYLIEKGVDITAKNNEGETALHSAVQSGKIQFVDAVLSINKNLLTITDNQGYPPLFHICLYGPDVLQTLIEHGANTLFTTSDGKTVLHVIIHEFLRGAYLYADTPLKEKAKTTIDSLIDSGANVNAVDKDGRTPLHWAQYGDMDDPHAPQILWVHGEREKHDPLKSQDADYVGDLLWDHNAEILPK